MNMVVGQGIMPDITPAKIGDGVTSAHIDLETLCSISLIRTHTKTDDVPSVTDEQLILYRRAAFEAAEQYTGMLLTIVKWMYDVVRVRNPSRMRQRGVVHMLRYPSADGQVYIYGAANAAATRLISIEPGTRRIVVDASEFIHDAMSCCAKPCDSGFATGSGWGEGTLRAMYQAGFSRAEEVPAGVISGALKYIAWMVQNPGDEIMTVRNRPNQGESGIIGTNNIAWASGALELWRQYDPEAI